MGQCEQQEQGDAIHLRNVQDETISRDNKIGKFKTETKNSKIRQRGQNYKLFILTF